MTAITLSTRKTIPARMRFVLSELRRHLLAEISILRVELLQPEDEFRDNKQRRRVGILIKNPALLQKLRSHNMYGFKP
jgi:hypothetical protein